MMVLLGRKPSTTGSFQAFFILTPCSEPDSSDNDSNLKPFSRNDRNQVLSFVLSVRPSLELSQRKVAFAIVFPCTSVSTFKLSELKYTGAEFAVGADETALVRSKITTPKNALSIKFVGINIGYFTDALLTQSTLGKEIFAEIMSGDFAESQKVAKV